MQKSLRFCHVAHSMKRIEVEILLEIRTNLKIETFYFLWFNVSRLLFVTFFIQYFKTTICFIGSMFQDFYSLSHTKNSLHFHLPFPLLLHYTHAYNPSCYPISNTLKQKMMSFTFKFQPFNDTYVTPILWYHLILTCMSRL